EVREHNGHRYPRTFERQTPMHHLGIDHHVLANIDDHHVPPRSIVSRTSISRPSAPIRSGRGDPMTLQRPTYEELAARVAALEQAQAEALEREQATADVLRVISRSPDSADAALQVVADTALRLCHGDLARVYLRDGDYLVGGPSASASAQYVYRQQGFRLGPLDEARGATGVAFHTGQMVHTEDYVRYGEAAGIRPEVLEMAAETSAHTGLQAQLNVPLMRGVSAVGVLTIMRVGERRFSDRDVALAATFADQAVIAIENARLFRELQESNATLREALEQQTATAEVLSIISRSPTDVEPVLAAVAERAARLCGAVYGRIFQVEGDMVRGTVG